ncbi:MAG: hypothetical protein DI529_10045 [Chryseobacterium sp.]|nr:MAG: hypothetical protein DI529_10045 [Chryseobacterium sp.]
MRKKKEYINRYDLSPLASGGIIIHNMESERGDDAHDVFSPHRDLHYMLIVFVDGSVKFKIDFEDVPLKTVTLIRPGQIHQILEFGIIDP